MSRESMHRSSSHFPGTHLEGLPELSRRQTLLAGIGLLAALPVASAVPASAASAANILLPAAPLQGRYRIQQASNSRPKRIGSSTLLRSGAMLFSMKNPVTSIAAASSGSHAFNSRQNLSSNQSETR